jgi:hypothetical protein
LQNYTEISKNYTQFSQLRAYEITQRHTTIKRDSHPMLPAGFEPAISATERPQTHAFNGAATEMGIKSKYLEYPEKTHSQCPRKMAHGLLWDRTQASTVRGRLLTIVWGLNLEICMEALRKAMISLSGQRGILQNTSAPDRWLRNRTETFNSTLSSQVVAAKCCRLNGD